MPKRGTGQNSGGVGRKVLAYDIGGTKVAAGVVDQKGRVLEELREPIEIQAGKSAVINQLARLGRSLLESHPGIKRVGIASAGPLDPDKGILLDPTNFAGPDGNWGAVPIAGLLSRKLGKIPVFLENDAAAAMLAEHWVGAARRFENAMILTLGTGLGTGMIIDGQLVRSGRGLHPEAGHVIVSFEDATAPCGCGNLGCAEAYLSGRSFARRARVRFGHSTLTAEAIADLARRRDPRALASFQEYARVLAIAIHNYAVLYAPELVVVTGSFAEAADLFLEDARVHLAGLLKRRRIGKDLLPELKVSALKNRAGLIGGAYVAFHR